jgi:CRISPR-associated endonuclease Csy4
MSASLTNYVEITLITDGISTINDIWRIVFRQIHLALVDSHNSEIGLSFPGYRFDRKNKTLGEKVRIFSASEASLKAINLEKWLLGLSEYCHISKIRQVPKEVAYGCFGRKQYKNNYDKIIRSKMVHLGVSEAEAKALVGEYVPVKCDLPYIPYQSMSSMEAGRSADMLVSIQMKVVESEVLGSFNSFGLSNRVTVPIF